MDFWFGFIKRIKKIKFAKLVLEDFARAKFRGTKQQIRTLHFAKLELLDQKRTSYLSEVVLIKLKIGNL